MTGQQRRRVQQRRDARAQHCREVVRGDSKHRPKGCPCRNAPEHTGVHECSCGAQWYAGGWGLPITVVKPPPYPAICGWGA